MINKEKRFILNLICLEVFHKNVNLQNFKDLDYNYILKIAKKHYIINIIYRGIKDCNLSIPEEIKKDFDFESCKATEKYAVMSAEEEYLTREFNNHDIKYMLLKGGVIRKLYPSPEMRTSLDMDILYENKDKDLINEILLNAGYKYINTLKKDIIYHKEPVFSLEMHHNLTDDDLYYSGAEVWKRAVPDEENKNSYKMSNEDFYIFMIYHIAKHYKSGGCGIRPIIDLHLFLLAYNDKLNRNYIENELKKQGYLKFSKQLEKLCLVWFENEEGSDITDDLTNYIFFNEAFGLKTSNSLSKIVFNYKPKNVSKLIYILNRLFLKPSLLKTRYPILNNFPVLYPLFYIIRIFDALLFKRKIVTAEFIAVSGSTVDNFRKHYIDIGLIKK